MESISIFDIYKVGVGPSSSHTLGPWKAALDFLTAIEKKEFDQVKIQLFGSLSKTGKGHCTDLAIQLGLLNHQPESIDTSSINGIIASIKEKQQIEIHGKTIDFSPENDIVFHDYNDDGHPNTMTITALNQGSILHEQTYYSIGGGFIEKKGVEELVDSGSAKLPYPVQNAADLLRHAEENEIRISEVVFQNELTFRKEEKVVSEMHNIFENMRDCVYRGCTTEGVLPGILNVKRRAKKLSNDLVNGFYFSNKEEWFELIKKSNKDFTTINKWVSTFALAVNEENADLGRVVTSPTNGASGVIPAVLLYFYMFHQHNGIKDVERFLLTSGEIGCIFKKGATISAAVGGCQAEIGVSSAMAAAGLTEVMGGSPKQVCMAAEIAMEHHLGLTCDPIGGLVQIPCIERNAMGAMKAITACNLALSGDPFSAIVDLDMAVKSMWETAQEMNSKYKETSEGGLAVNVAVPEC
jgi:L-serine dehydratase